MSCRHGHASTFKTDMRSCDLYPQVAEIAELSWGLPSALNT